jgi:hypothetical protein
MINLDNAIITKCIVHKVGNSYASESSVFSNLEMEMEPHELLEIKKIFTKNFKAPRKANQFAHPIDLNQNVIFKLLEDMFESDTHYLKNTKNIVKYLFEQSTHYSIKAGEVFIMNFEDVVHQDVLSNAIGIFKIENSTNFIKSDYHQNSINIFLDKGIVGRNIEKGCIVFNSEAEDGYIVYSYEKNNTDTNYWNKNFLSIVKREDSFNTTSTLLETYRDFVMNDIPSESMNKKDKIELVNKSIEYVGEQEECMSVEEFIHANLVDENVQHQYKAYLDNYKEAYEVEIEDTVVISKDAVKYQQKKFKSIIKLDKNFHIYVHTNDELIEQGVDEHGRKYYKLYYENEL